MKPWRRRGRAVLETQVLTVTLEQPEAGHILWHIHWDGEDPPQWKFWFSVDGDPFEAWGVASGEDRNFDDEPGYPDDVTLQVRVQMVDGGGDPYPGGLGPVDSNIIVYFTE